MSELVRIALVAEGVTDYEVIRASIAAMLGERPFDLKLLQPEGSVAFAGQGEAGPFGGGWRGVYRWCRQATERANGPVSTDVLFLNYHILIVHLDADVAAEDPANYPVNPLPELRGVVPCERPCPPATDTTNALRAVMSNWLGEETPPPALVLCTPSKSIEAWVVAICFPSDKTMNRLGWECYPEPGIRLGQQPKGKRFSKTQAAYEQRYDLFRQGWPDLVRQG